MSLVVARAVVMVGDLPTNADPSAMLQGKNTGKVMIVNKGQYNTLSAMIGQSRALDVIGQQTGAFVLAPNRTHDFMEVSTPDGPEMLAYSSRGGEAHLSIYVNAWDGNSFEKQAAASDPTVALFWTRHDTGRDAFMLGSRKIQDLTPFTYVHMHASVPPRAQAWWLMVNLERFFYTHFNDPEQIVWTQGHASGLGPPHQGWLAQLMFDIIHGKIDSYDAVNAAVRVRSIDSAVTKAVVGSYVFGLLARVTVGAADAPSNVERHLVSGVPYMRFADGIIPASSFGCITTSAGLVDEVAGSTLGMTGATYLSHTQFALPPSVQRACRGMPDCLLSRNQSIEHVIKEFSPTPDVCYVRRCPKVVTVNVVVLGSGMINEVLERVRTDVGARVEYADGRYMAEMLERNGDEPRQSVIYILETTEQCPTEYVCSIVYVPSGQITNSSERQNLAVEVTSMPLDMIVRDLISLRAVIDAELQDKYDFEATLLKESLPGPRVGGQRPDGSHVSMPFTHLLTSCPDSAKGMLFKAYSGMDIDDKGLIGGRAPVVLDARSRWMCLGLGNQFAHRMRTYGLGRDISSLLRSAAPEPKNNQRARNPSGHMLSALSLPVSHFLWYLNELTLNINGQSFLTAVIKYAGQPADGATFHSMVEYEDAVHVYSMDFATPGRLPLAVKHRGAFNLAIAHQFIASHK